MYLYDKKQREGRRLMSEKEYIAKYIKNRGYKKLLKKY
jgi:hypothetical protein